MKPSKIKEYMQLCIDHSKISKDLHTKIAALVIGPDLEIRASGYNWLPRKVKEKEYRLQRPEKYRWTEHAERNAIYNAARVGTPLKGSYLFVTMYPCLDCARAIIQAGISKVYTTTQESTASVWSEQRRDVKKMLKEAGVSIKVLPAELFVWPNPVGGLTKLTWVDRLRFKLFFLIQDMKAKINELL